jgi:DNA-binding transcriptional LysR family regulator
MFRHLPSLKTLLAFEAAARHASFSAAANELLLSQGAISYQIKQLEKSIDTLLFHRRTRQVELTDAGQRLFRQVHRLLNDLDVEIQAITPGKRDMLLTVSVSTFFVTRWLSRRLGDFLNAYPHVTVRLQHSVNNPDFAIEEVDLAIRWGDGQWSNCSTQKLLELPMMAVCAPELLESHKKPELVQHKLLHDQPGIDYWFEWYRAAGLELQDNEDRTVIVDPNVRVQAAIDGHGLTLANPLIEDEIEAGRLIEPFNIRLNGYAYYLVSSSDTTPRKPVHLFEQWLKDQIAKP